MTNRKNEAASPDLPPILPPEELEELSAGLQHVDIASEQSGDSPEATETEEPIDSQLQEEENILTEDIPIMARCPDGRQIDYDLYWYHLTDMPKGEPIHLICSRCFVDHIQGTELAGEFAIIHWPGSVATTCSFCLPVIKDSLWPAALETGNADLLRAHLSRRAKVKPCAGMQGSRREQSATWYGMLNRENETQEFMMCEACFLDYAVGGNFEAKFLTYPDDWESDIWFCDLRFPYTRQALREYGTADDWDSFLVAASWRHALKNCSGDMVGASSTQWYYPRHSELRNMQICLNCYLDNWGLTLFDDEFQQEHRGPLPGSSDYPLFLVEWWKCDFGLNVPLITAAEESKAQGDFAIFAEAASAIVASPPCTQEGITYGEGWTLVGGCEAFVICHACYVGIFWPVPGLQNQFERTTWRAADAKLCSLHKTAPRWKQYLGHLDQARDYDDWSIFSSFVREYAPVAVCPRNDAYTGRSWWGYPEARCCGECWIDWVSKTPLADLVPLQGEESEEAQLCQMWSPRMRTLWLAVCATAEAGSEELDAAVTEFREIAQNREAVYCETMPPLRRLKAVKYAADRNVAAQAMASVAYGGMQSLAVVSSMTDGHRHGNSSVGWHDTESGAMAAQARNNMVASMQGAPSRDAQILRLQALWNEVE